MKKRAALLMCIMLITGGCEGQDENLLPSPTNPKEGVKTMSVSFEHLDVHRAPGGVAQAFEKNKNSETTLLFEEQGKYWILITRGVKPTGGYSVRISDIRLEQDGNGKSKLIVQYLYCDPKPGQFVTQVLTTPSTLVRLKGLKKKPDEVVFVKQD